MIENGKEYENGLSPAKIAQGRRDLHKQCVICGKSSTRHSNVEAAQCKRAISKTLKEGNTLLRRMSDKGIEKAEMRKI